MAPFPHRREQPSGRAEPAAGAQTPASALGRASETAPGKEALRGDVRPDLSAGSRVWGLVTSRFNEEICQALEDGARSCLIAHGAAEDAILTFRVPGAFEIAPAARAILDLGRADAVIGLGAVIRGETPHFDYVCEAVTQGLSRLAYETARPVAFGVLTADTIEQARARAGGARGNKGWEAALAALEMAQLFDSLTEAPRVGFRRSADQ